MVKPRITEAEAEAEAGAEADVAFSEGETAVSFRKSPLAARATWLVMTGLDLYLDMDYWVLDYNVEKAKKDVKEANKNVEKPVDANHNLLVKLSVA